MKKYVSKKESRIDDSFVEFGEHSMQGKSSAWEEVAECIQGGEATKVQLWTEHHGVMSTRYKAAYEMMQVIGMRPDKADYKLESFDWNEITDWTKSIVLWGESQIGKTQFALAHFDNPLMVSHIDKLTQFDPKLHDGIVFDDMSFGHTPRTAQIHLADQGNNREIHVRYTYASIPAHTKKIFTTNERDGAIFDLTDTAITNRLNIIECEGNHADKKRRRIQGHSWAGAIVL